MAVKVTFTLDPETVRKLELAARRLGKPKSQVVREAIREYEARSDRLSDEERDELVKVFKAYVSQPPERPDSDIDDELRELREVRRLPGRLHPVD